MNYKGLGKRQREIIALMQSDKQPFIRAYDLLGTRIEYDLSDGQNDYMRIPQATFISLQKRNLVSKFDDTWPSENVNITFYELHKWK